MPENAPATVTIKLTGDWSMTGVTQQLVTLTEHLATLSREQPQQNRQVIDLAEVSQFDACGCQLLTILCRHLKLLGFAPVLNNITDELRSHIKLLGFDHEFGTMADIAMERA